ncbi:MAG: WD40 repeat domain-containing protein, partial [Pirellulaceae bacterium]
MLTALVCAMASCAVAFAQQIDPANTALIRVLHSLGDQNRVQTGMIRNVLLLSDGTQALTCGTDGCVCLWDIESQKIIRRFADEDCIIAYCMVLTADEKRLITAGQGGPVNLWDVETGERIRSWDHTNTVFSIVLREDQQSFLFGDSQGQITLQRLDADEPVKSFRDTSNDVTALTLLPDGSGFLSGNDQGTVSVWQFDGEEPADSLEGLEGTICCLRYSNEGNQLLGCDYNGNVMMWNADDRKKIWRKKELSGDIVWAHFLDDETAVVVDADDAFYLLNRETGNAKKKDIKLPAAAGFVLSPDKQTIWSGGNNVLCGWDLETAERVFPS